MSSAAEREVATLGGGCFWCLDAVYRHLKGVEKVQSGYAGGTKPDPTYKEVCGGQTGHAEVVQITFDPSEISYRDLLDVFFTIHDPTTKDRQGGDIGPQYRSIILTHSDEQARVAREAMAEVAAQGIWDDPIVTEVVPLTTFYGAERYHQDYFANNQRQPYCQVVIAPKVAKFRRKFLEKVRV
jgi:peptide-methionine (S)-S-oxide reductase